MLDLIYYNYTLERKDGFIIIKYNSRTEAINIKSNISYKIGNNNYICLINNQNNNIYRLDYTKCTNIIKNSLEEFINYLQKLIKNTDLDYNFEIALGHISNDKNFIVYGYSENIGTTYSTLWQCDTSLDYILGITGEKINITSSSSNDINGGTGANNVYIYGTSNDNEYVEELVLLNGTTSVSTTNNFTFINRAVVLNTGNINTNEGDINFISNDTNKKLCCIPTNCSTTQQLLYKVPKNKKIYVKSCDLTVHKIGQNTPPIVEIQLYFHYNNGTILKSLINEIDSSINNNLKINFETNQLVFEGTIIELKVKSNINNVKVSGFISIHEFDIND